jgi:hypothetical protein
MAPRTPYGHKIHLPLVEDGHESPPILLPPTKEGLASMPPFSPSGKDDVGSEEMPLSGLERLVRSHAIWFLPAVTRDEAASFLHTKEEGVRF